MKKSLFYWFGFLFLLLWMSSCSRKVVANNSSVKDSTYVKKTIVPKDTSIVIPGNKVQVSANINAINETPVKNRSGNLTASLRRVGNTIIADCDQEKNELIIQLQNELIEIYRLKELSQTATVEVKKTPEYLKPFIWLGAFALIAIIVAIGIYFLKKSK